MTEELTLLEKIEEARHFLKWRGCDEPEFGLILGSGLGELAEEITNSVTIPYETIPHWGKSTVVGHAGKLVYGDLGGHKVMALQGRFHFSGRRKCLVHCHFVARYRSRPIFARHGKQHCRRRASRSHLALVHESVERRI